MSAVGVLSSVKGVDQPIQQDRRRSQKNSLCRFTLVKAPLTLIRSRGPAELRISVLFTDRMMPLNPVVPPPTHIDFSTRKYTWNVLTRDDGAFFARGKTGLDVPVQLIWWEAIRKGASECVNHFDAACVRRTNLKPFLTFLLSKLGVHQRELEAFTYFWDETFNKNPQASSEPYLLVQMIDPKQLMNYVPAMQIEGEDAHRFALNRYYFRFQPIPEQNRGIPPDLYLSQMQIGDLGENAVIDLGGEIVHATPIPVSGLTVFDGNFNEAFSKNYVFTK